jgi:hypothetical protein
MEAKERLPSKEYILVHTEPLLVNLLRSPGIGSQQWWAGIGQPFLTYRPPRLHRLAESIPWNRFRGSLNIYKVGLSIHYTN